MHDRMRVAPNVASERNIINFQTHPTQLTFSLITCLMNLNLLNVAAAQYHFLQAFASSGAPGSIVTATTLELNPG